MKRNMLLALAVSLAAALACGEKPEPEAEPEAAPVLQSTTPASGADNQSYPTLDVVFTYDQNIKAAQSKQSEITIDSPASVTRVNAYNEKLTVSLEGLEGGREYTLTIPSGLVSGFKENQPAAGGASLKFKTKEAPAVIPDPDPDVLPARGDNIAWKMAEKLALGFNLGNQMDAYVNDVANETCWGNPAATQQTFDRLKSYGFSTVRIPVTWMGHIGEAPDYRIDEAWMNRVAEIVGYAEKAGLSCIVNTHHDENHSNGAAHWQDIKSAVNSKDANARIKDEIRAVWTQIAEKFKDRGDWLIFESFNEINDGGWGWSDAFRKNPQAQYDILNEWNQVFVDAVRSTGGNNATRWLGVPGYAANIQFTLAGLVLPQDSAKDRLMVAVHCYDPSSFCGAGTDGKHTEWGHTGESGKKPSEGERELRKTFATVYEAYVKNGIPCYIGEFGCVNKTTERGRDFQKYYLEYFCKAASCYGLPCILWDNGVAATNSGEAFGYVHHGTGEYIGNGSTVVPAMSKGQNDTSPAYTLESVYSNAPK